MQPVLNVVDGTASLHGGVSWTVYLPVSMTVLVRVQRVVMPSGVESATVVRDGEVVACVDRFLAHLTAVERSPNTVRAYAHDLRDFFAFLESRAVAWDRVVLEDLGKFVTWLRLSDTAREGNVTNPEMMGELDWKETRNGINWARNSALLKAGIKAVRDASATTAIKPRIMLHIAQPENVEPWFAAATEYGVTDYDLIGVSYYRKWSTQDLAGLGATIQRLNATYDADVVVVETSYPFTNDGADTSPNLLGPDTLLPQYPATQEGQLRYMTDITQVVIDNGGTGVVYWEPAWVSTRCSTRWGRGSNWENATFFDWRQGNDVTMAAHWAKAAYRWPEGAAD